MYNILQYIFKLIFSEMTSNEVKTLLKNVKDAEEKLEQNRVFIQTYVDESENIRRQIEIMREQLHSRCQHVWKRDQFSSYERKLFICESCGNYK